MRFSLFTSMDTKSPPTVFIFISIIILPSSRFGLHSQIPKLSSVLSLLFVSSLTFSLFSLYYEVLFLLDFILLPFFFICSDDTKSSHQRKKCV